MILGPNLYCRATGGARSVAGRTSDEGTRARRGDVAGGGPRVTPVKTRINERCASRGKRIKEGKRRKMTSWNARSPHLERKASRQMI